MNIGFWRGLISGMAICSFALLAALEAEAGAWKYAVTAFMFAVTNAVIFWWR